MLLSSTFTIPPIGILGVFGITSPGASLGTDSDDIAVIL